MKRQSSKKINVHPNVGRFSFFLNPSVGILYTVDRLVSFSFKHCFKLFRGIGGICEGGREEMVQFFDKIN